MLDDIHILACTTEGCTTACNNCVLVLDRFAPWCESRAGSPFVYVVHPSDDGHYLVQAVAGKCGDPLLPFPPDWRGASPSALRRMTKVDDFLSCSPDGCVCTTRTQESAVELASLSLKGDWHLCYQCPRPCPSCV